MIETKREEHQKIVSTNLGAVRKKSLENKKRIFGIESLLKERIETIREGNNILSSPPKDFTKEDLDFFSRDLFAIKDVYWSQKWTSIQLYALRSIADRDIADILLDTQAKGVDEGLKKYAMVVSGTEEMIDSFIGNYLCLEEQRVVDGVSYYEDSISSDTKKYEKLLKETEHLFTVNRLHYEKTELGDIKHRIWTLNLRLHLLRKRVSDIETHRKELLIGEKSTNEDYLHVLKNKDRDDTDWEKTSGMKGLLFRRRTA